MLEKITHWILGSNRALTIDAEELTALELVGRNTKLVNDCVDTINNMLTTGIQQPLRDALNNMANDGELESLIQSLIILDGGTF